MLLRRDVSPDFDSLRAFRNALAFSCIVKAWEGIIAYGIQGEHLRFSNYLDFYPYTLSKDEQYLLVHTSSQFGADDPSRFQGQSSPELVRLWQHDDFYDETLFHAILELWTNRYVRRKTREWRTLALFRSLEMAYRASAAPQLHMYDYGAQLALWVSAFEILVHPKTDKADLERVLHILGQSDFIQPGLKQRLYTVVLGRKHTKTRVNLIQKTYYEMYSCRNDFLHGNPVSFSKLFPAKNPTYHSLLPCAVLIYKCALMVFLKIFGQLPDCDVSELNDLSEEKIKEMVRLSMCQSYLERALLNMRTPK